ncbi:MAG: hypothetical protein V2A56_06660 [bacterium]
MSMRVWTRWFALLALGLLSTQQGARAQQSTDPILTYFDGGRMNLNFELNSMLAGGPGVTSVAVGAAAPVQADPYAVFRNPAGLRFVRHDVIIGITLHPEVGIRFSSIPFDIQQGINDAVDGYIEGFQSTDDFSYPVFDGTVARSASSLNAFAVAVPFGGWRIGFGYDRPIHLKMDLLHAGFRQRIDTVESNPADAVAFAIQTRINDLLEIDADRLVVAFSRDVFRWLTLGASATRTLVAIDLNAGYNIDGIMTRGGQQWAFNNDADPWYNALHSLAVGGYSGSWWTVRAGFTIAGQSEKSWRLGAEIVRQQPPELHGSMTMVVDEFPALKLSAGADEDPFDVNRISDVTEITRTYPNTYLLSDRLTLHVPDAATVTIAAGGGLRPSLSGIYYLNGKFGYDVVVQEKSVQDSSYSTHLYGRGIVLQYGGYFGIAPGPFFFGVGAMLGKDYVDGYVDGSGNPIPGGNMVIIPRLDLGFSFHVSRNLRYEIMIAGLPEDVLRMGISYEF